VLSTLLASRNERVKKLQISALVRRQDQADKLAQLGVASILSKDLEEAAPKWGNGSLQVH
jgi:hypothetical protein